MYQTIIDAISTKNLIEFNYDGESRIVEPHCYGLTTKMNEAIRAFQVDGYSSSGKMGWKLYDLSKADSITMIDEIFETRSDYKQGDRGMTEIYCEI